MSALSDYLELALVRHVLGGSAFTAPSTMYLALFTSPPADDAVGTEVAGGGYQRVSITNNTTNWPNASIKIKANGTTITFPTATADWGTVTHWALMTSPTDDTEILAHGAFTTATEVESGSTFAVGEGGLVITAPEKFSQTFAHAVLDHVFGKTTYSAPGTVYMVLCLGEPDTTDGVASVEVSGYNYARKAITNNSTNWTDGTGTSRVSGAAVTFNQATGGPWGTVTHWALMNNGTLSNQGDAYVMMWGVLTSPTSIVNTNTPQFAAGDILISLD